MKRFIVLVLVILVFFSSVFAFDIKKSEFDSTVLKEKVKLQIYLPLGYNKTTGNYPVFYLLDGNFFMNHAVSAIDFLSTSRYMNGLIPKFIIIGITTKDRNHDLTPTFDKVQSGMKFPTSGGAENFHKFLTHELFTFVKNKYRITKQRVLAGWSLGGLFTTWTYLKHPDSFDKYLAISPSLWWDDMIVCNWADELIKKKSLANKKFTMTLGSLEAGDMPDSVKGRFLPLMKKQKQNSSFNYIEIKNEGHNTSPYISIYRGLKSLMFFAAIPDKIVNGKIDEMKKYFLKMASENNYNTKSIDKACNFLIKQSVTQGKYKVGLQIADIYANKLSLSSKALLNLAEMYLRSNRDKEAIKTFENAIIREQKMKNPDLKVIKHLQGYMEWAKKRIK